MKTILSIIFSSLLLLPLVGYLGEKYENNLGGGLHRQLVNKINGVELDESAEIINIQSASCVIKVMVPRDEETVGTCQGSATCIGSDSQFYYLLTCRHIFSPAEKDTMVELQDRKVFIYLPIKFQGAILPEPIVARADLLAVSDVSVDLALVAVERGDVKCGMGKVSVDFHLTPHITEGVYLCSSPRGEFTTFTPGSVVKYSYFFDKIQTVVSCTCSEGSSGGGLYNKNYNLIGVLSRRAQFNENISFAVSNIEVSKWLKDINFAGRINHN